MAKRTNRVAWGLAAVLALVLVMALAVGYKAWSAGAETISVFLLKPSDKGFGRFRREVSISTSNDELTAEVLCLGVVRVVKQYWPRSPAGPPVSTSSGTERHGAVSRE